MLFRSQFVLKEMPIALATCQNDRTMSGAFDCYRLQRVIYNYRMSHAHDAGPPEPLADLFAGEKLDCTDCIIDNQVKMWARSAAQSRGLVPTQADCASERFVASIQSRPYPNHVKERFDAAIAACKK